MENQTASPVMELVTNETLIKQVANFFNVSVANVTNQSVVQQETLFDLYEAYRTQEKEQLTAYKTVAYVVGTLIILSNLIVVVSSGLILRRGQQPKSTYLLLGNVSLADTIIGAAIIFGSVIDNSVASNPLCIFQIGMIVCPAIVSIFSVGLIAVDRYFYILHGLYYQRYFNTTRVRIAIVIIWMIGPAREIGSLEGKLDILSAKPAARVESNQLQALVRLSPEVKQQWLRYFDERQITYKKVVDNLAEAFRDEDSQIEAARESAKRSGRNIGWDTYYRHQEINDHLDALAAQYPNLVTVINPALSYEGRQIKYVRISTTRFEDLRKPVIIIDAMVHAREWVTTPVALYIINQLVVDAVDSQLTQDIDWIIIPLANPDGYEYTHDEDRLWRKTRSKSHPGSDQCPGVDGNRNFDHYWGTSESSANPCSIIYEGPSAFSEPEIRVIRDVVNQHLERAAMYISLHSYGNMFLYAWGNNGTLPSNGLALHLAGVTMATAIDSLALDNAPRYVVGNAAQVLYFTSGTSRDWTRAVGIPLTYTLELPGYEYLFEVPAQYVEQIVKETWAGIAAGAHYVRSIFG